MQRRQLLGMLFLLAIGGAAPAAETRPNIVFILADDIGITGFSCYGGGYQTPRVDALAKSGMRFDYCFSAPLCAPSRAMCMTGRYAFRTGVTNNGTGGQATPQRETSIAKVLKQAGYTTAVAGKWRQLQYLTTPEEAAKWGFDEFLVWYDKGGGERYWDPHYNHNGKPVQAGAKAYGPDLLHEFAVDFINRNQDRPFFLYYPTVLVHAPIVATPDSKAGNAKKKGHFPDNMAYLDKLVGKLVDELDRRKLLEKTMIVFVGDNGTVGGGTLNGRHVDGGKGTMKEGGSRVPLIVSWKGTIQPGQVCKDLVDFSDFFPTFAEVGGARLPAGVNIDGRSFAPQLRGQPGQPRDWAYVQLGQQRYVRDPRWKLYGDGTLCDMSEAPFAEKAISKDSADVDALAARKRLQAALDQLR